MKYAYRRVKYGLRHVKYSLRLCEIAAWAAVMVSLRDD